MGLLTPVALRNDSRPDPDLDQETPRVGTEDSVGQRGETGE